MQNTAERKINVTIRMPPRLAEALRREAAREERSFGDHVRRLLAARQRPKSKDAA
jgi:Ribbon-helix-helix protein, copG family